MCPVLGTSWNYSYYLQIFQIFSCTDSIELQHLAGLSAHQIRPDHHSGRWWDVGRVRTFSARGVNVVNDCHAAAGALRVVTQSKHALKFRWHEKIMVQTEVSDQRSDKNALPITSCLSRFDYRRTRYLVLATGHHGSLFSEAVLK